MSEIQPYQREDLEAMLQDAQQENLELRRKCHTLHDQLDTMEQQRNKAEAAFANLPGPDHEKLGTASRATDLQRRKAEALDYLQNHVIVSTNGPNPPVGQEALFSVQVSGKRIDTFLENVESAMAKEREGE